MVGGPGNVGLLYKQLVADSNRCICSWSLLASQEYWLENAAMLCPSSSPWASAYQEKANLGETEDGKLQRLDCVGQKVEGPDPVLAKDFFL